VVRYLRQKDRGGAEKEVMERILVSGEEDKVQGSTENDVNAAL
jgi:hypothetical protein